MCLFEGGPVQVLLLVWVSEGSDAALAAVGVGKCRELLAPFSPISYHQQRGACGPLLM